MQVELEPGQADGWRLSSADLTALNMWGLPVVTPSGFTPDIQIERVPRIQDEGATSTSW